MMLEPKTADDIRANREEWAQALESGAYPQGRKYLTDGDGGYCCFGVLCELIDPTRTQWEPTNTYPDNYLLSVVGYSLSAERDTFTPSNGAFRLAVANDTGTPFTEIANLIRAAPMPPLPNLPPYSEDAGQ